MTGNTKSITSFLSKQLLQLLPLSLLTLPPSSPSLPHTHTHSLSPSLPLLSTLYSLKGVPNERHRQMSIVM